MVLGFGFAGIPGIFRYNPARQTPGITDALRGSQEQAMTYRVGSGKTLSRHINHRGFNTGPAPTVRMFAVFTCRAVSKRVHNLMERWAVIRLIGPRKRREE